MLAHPTCGPPSIQFQTDVDPRPPPDPGRPGTRVALLPGKHIPPARVPADGHRHARQDLVLRPRDTLTSCPPPSPWHSQ
eukprot:3490995-Prymnesium_polylepis.1